MQVTHSNPGASHAKQLNIESQSESEVSPSGLSALSRLVASGLGFSGWGVLVLSVGDEFLLVFSWKGFCVLLVVAACLRDLRSRAA